MMFPRPLAPALTIVAALGILLTGCNTVNKVKAYGPLAYPRLDDMPKLNDKATAINILNTHCIYYNTRSDLRSYFDDKGYNHVSLVKVGEPIALNKQGGITVATYKAVPSSPELYKYSEFTLFELCMYNNPSLGGESFWMHPSSKPIMADNGCGIISMHTPKSPEKEEVTISLLKDVHRMSKVELFAKSKEDLRSVLSAIAFLCPTISPWDPYHLCYTAEKDFGQLTYIDVLPDK